LLKKKHARAASGHGGVAAKSWRRECGFKLANQGVDTRSLQHYLGSVFASIVYEFTVIGRFIAEQNRTSTRR
jgi:hypothetical protein